MNEYFMRLHIPTGYMEKVAYDRESPGVLRGESIYQSVNRWNRIGGEVWKYWVE